MQRMTEMLIGSPSDSVDVSGVSVICMGRDVENYKGDIISAVKYKRGDEDLVVHAIATALASAYYAMDTPYESFEDFWTATGEQAKAAALQSVGRNE